MWSVERSCTSEGSMSGRWMHCTPGSLRKFLITVPTPWQDITIRPMTPCQPLLICYPQRTGDKTATRRVIQEPSRTQITWPLQGNGGLQARHGQIHCRTLRWRIAPSHGKAFLESHLPCALTRGSSLTFGRTHFGQCRHCFGAPPEPG